MPLTKQEQKELSKLQKEANDAIEREKQNLLYAYQALKKQIQQQENLSRTYTERLEQERQDEHYTPSLQTAHSNRLKMESMMGAHQLLLTQLKSIQASFRDYDTKQKELNGWFEEAKTYNSLIDLKAKFPVELISSKIFQNSDPIQAVFSKVSNFVYTQPLSLVSKIKSAWNNFFFPQKNPPIAEARVSEVLIARPVEADSFLEPSSSKLPIATPVVPRGQLLRTLSSKVEEIHLHNQHDAQNDHLFASMEKALEKGNHHSPAQEKQQEQKQQEQSAVSEEHPVLQ